MSTYVYLVCLDHDPPLVAEDESGQHLYDLPRIRAEIAGVDAPAPSGQHPDATAYFRRNSERFLLQHRGCRIGIRDEHGRDHDTEEDGRDPDDGMTDDEAAEGFMAAIEADWRCACGRHLPCRHCDEGVDRG